MQDLIRQLLAELGEDPDREGLVETPRRVDQSFRALTSGYSTDIDGVQWISVSAAVGSDVRGLVRAQTLDDARGEQLRSVVGGAVAAARMFTQQDPRLAAALDSVQATGTGPNVELSFRISPELLDLISQHRDRVEGNLLPPPADN